MYVRVLCVILIVLDALAYKKFLENSAPPLTKSWIRLCLFNYIWGVGKFPPDIVWQSLATVRRPALNEMSSGHKVITSWVRTRLILILFLGPYHTEKGIQMLPFLFS